MSNTPSVTVHYAQAILQAAERLALPLPAELREPSREARIPLARQDDRIGGGHPEGLFDAWSNLYRRFAIAMDAADRRDEALLADFWYPDARAGAFGVRWVENCVRSADNGACWVNFR